MIGIPGGMCFAVVATLKAQSPFPVTLIWDSMGPWSSLAHIIPEVEGAVGGAHRGMCDYAQEAIDQMVGAIVDALQTLYHEVRLQEPAAPV